MKELIINAIKVAKKVTNKKGFATTGTVVASGVLGVFGILSRPEEVLVDNSDLVDADSDSVTETIEHTVRQRSEDNDFILADEAEVVEDVEVEDVEVEEVEVEEVEEVEEANNQDLAPENNATETQATTPNTNTTEAPARSNQLGNASQEHTTQTGNRSNAQEQARAERERAEEQARAEREARERAAEEARIAAEEEAARIAAEEEAARQAEQAQRVETSHNQPNVLLRNGSVVAEGAGRVWYYNGPVDGLSYTDSSGNVKSGNINSVRVNGNYVSEDGIDYSSYTSGRMAPIIIQATDGGYILHMFGR